MGTVDDIENSSGFGALWRQTANMVRGLSHLRKSRRQLDGHGFTEMSASVEANQSDHLTI